MLRVDVPLILSTRLYRADQCDGSGRPALKRSPVRAFSTLVGDGGWKAWSQMRREKWGISSVGVRETKGGGPVTVPLQKVGVDSLCSFTCITGPEQASVPAGRHPDTRRLPGEAAAEQPPLRPASEPPFASSITGECCWQHHESCWLRAMSRTAPWLLRESGL